MYHSAHHGTLGTSDASLSTPQHSRHFRCVTQHTMQRVSLNCCPRKQTKTAPRFSRQEMKHSMLSTSLQYIYCTFRNVIARTHRKNINENTEFATHVHTAIHAHMNTMTTENLGHTPIPARCGAGPLEYLCFWCKQVSLFVWDPRNADIKCIVMQHKWCHVVTHAFSMCCGNWEIMV